MLIGLEGAPGGLERGEGECDSLSASRLDSDLCWPWHLLVAHTTASSSAVARIGSPAPKGSGFLDSRPVREGHS
jgi:hypothetical protein